MSRRIAYKGYYIRSAAVGAGAGLFSGLADITVEGSAPDAKVLERAISAGKYDSEEKAMQAAEYRARQVVDNLRPTWAPFTEPGVGRSDPPPGKRS
jgi:hypothetical protein